MEDDQESQRKRPEIVLGQDLEMMSIEELGDRITACESEISRIRALIDKKQQSQAAADTFFKN